MLVDRSRGDTRIGRDRNLYNVWRNILSKMIPKAFQCKLFDLDQSLLTCAFYGVADS